MWKVAICDDNASQAKELQQIIHNLDMKELSHVDLYSNGSSLAEDYRDHKLEADILFLDIDLQGRNGIEIAKEILDVQPGTKIVFISGFDDYYEDVYEVDHIYFIRKPICEEKVKRALYRAIENLRREKNDYVYIHNKNGKYVLLLSDIFSFEKDRRRVLIKGADGELCSFYGKFEELHHLRDKGVVRCHHSFLINLAKVERMEGNYFYLTNGRKIPISRTYSAEAKEMFLSFIEEL